MSGGGNKKKNTKIQGWEEAGSEFYQESYPTDAELEVLQKDPKHLATLLPSKQTRAAATTIRLRVNDHRSVKQQTASRTFRGSTIQRRTSTAPDVQVSMLPDLSENLSNERTTWEEIMEIKAMPIPMSEKKEFKAKILNEPNLRLQGYEQFKWKRRKLWKLLDSFIRETYSKWDIWQKDLKHIEGCFGTGVVTYFVFLRRLLSLNLVIFALFLFLIVLPNAILGGANCTCKNYDATIGEAILDFFQGTGYMECSALFYGYYSNETFSFVSSGATMYYNLPLAYICVIVLYFGISLLTIVKLGAKGVQEHLVKGEGQFYNYSNSIFGGWDFCISNEKSSNVKHRAIFNEIRACFETENFEVMRQNRTRGDTIKLIVNRLLVNAIVFGILAACGVSIYYTFAFSIEYNGNKNCDDNLEHLLYEFLPSFLIVCLNIIVPFVFKHIVTYENYRPEFVIKVSLVRTIFLRLASLIVFYASLHEIIKHGVSNKCSKIDCWETYVGQQIYKLVLTDFASHIVITFLVNFPRSMLARNTKNKFFKLLCEQTFDLPKHVLDIVYLQALCWLGCFYIPLMSFIYTLILFLMFQIKKFACLINSKPGTIIYRASRSNSLFMLLLLTSLIFAIVPITFTISELKPSGSCGPYRGLPSVWFEIESAFWKTPQWVQSTVSFLSTAGFAIPVFVVLFLLFYYFKAVNSANRHMVAVLKNNLVLEGHDKQFLLERLSKFIKRQQENPKCLNCVDVLQGRDIGLSN